MSVTSNPNNNSIKLDIFSTSSLLKSFTISNVQGAGTFFGGRSDTDPITRIELSGVNGNDYFGVDNIAFASNAVPESGSLALLGLGMAGLMFARRRQAVC